MEHGNPISHKNVIILALRWLLTPPPPPPGGGGNFVHYDFQILHYKGYKMKYVSTLRVVALAGNIMLHTLPAK